MTKVKTKRICAGEYVTTNTTPVATISKSVDDKGIWFVSYGHDEADTYGGYFGLWSNKRECLSLLESVHNDFTPETHDAWIDIK